MVALKLLKQISSQWPLPKKHPAPKVTSHMQAKADDIDMKLEQETLEENLEQETLEENLELQKLEENLEQQDTLEENLEHETLKENLEQLLQETLKEENGMENQAEEQEFELENDDVYAEDDHIFPNAPRPSRKHRPVWFGGYECHKHLESHIFGLRGYFYVLGLPLKVLKKDPLDLIIFGVYF